MLTRFPPTLPDTHPANPPVRRVDLRAPARLLGRFVQRRGGVGVHGVPVGEQQHQQRGDVHVQCWIQHHWLGQLARVHWYARALPTRAAPLELTLPLRHVLAARTHSLQPAPRARSALPAR